MIKPVFIFSISILLSCAFAQINNVGALAPGDMVTIPVPSEIGSSTFWASPTISIIDYSYEMADNELYLALCTGVHWKQRLRISMAIPVRRSHEGGIGDLLNHNLDWIGSRKRIVALIRIAELPDSRITIGLSLGLWQLAVPRYWDDPPRFTWNDYAGFHIDKQMNKSTVVLSFEVLRLSGEFQLEGDQHILIHAGAGCQKNITTKMIILGELRYDQAFPKYLDRELPEVLEWYSSSAGLKYLLSPHVMISVNVTIGFRNSIVFWPESKSSFDLAKEMVQISWVI